MGRLLDIRVLLIAFVCALALPAAADAAAGTTRSFTYGAGADAHPYIVHTPESYERSDPAPLVVMTHGCQTTAEQQMRSTQFNRVAERNGFVVLYPDVTDAQAQLPGALRRCWPFYAPTSWHRGEGDAAAIAGMTRAVIERNRIDRRRVYMVGMSAGSFMTSIMAAAYPQLFAAVAINAGGAYADATCIGADSAMTAAESAGLAADESGSRIRVIPRLVMGGDADQGIPPACADKALEQGLRTDNLAIDGRQTGPIPLEPSAVRTVRTPGRYATTVSAYRDPDGCLVGVRRLFHGMNHFWPGGSKDPQWANWTDPAAPNGARITWRFLSRYTKGGTAMPCAEATARR